MPSPPKKPVSSWQGVVYVSGSAATGKVARVPQVRYQLVLVTTEARPASRNGLAMVARRPEPLVHPPPS